MGGRLCSRTHNTYRVNLCKRSVKLVSGRCYRQWGNGCDCFRIKDNFSWMYHKGFYIFFAGLLDCGLTLVICNFQNGVLQYCGKCIYKHQMSTFANSPFSKSIKSKSSIPVNGFIISQNISDFKNDCFLLAVFDDRENIILYSVG